MASGGSGTPDGNRPSFSRSSSKRGSVSDGPKWRVKVYVEDFEESVLLPLKSISPSSTVASLKALICDEYHVPVELQHCIINEQLIEDGRCLDEASLEEDGVVYIFLYKARQVPEEPTVSNTSINDSRVSDDSSPEEASCDNLDNLDEQPVGWTCPRCTLKNEMNATICQTCEHPKNQPSQRHDEIRIPANLLPHDQQSGEISAEKMDLLLRINDSFQELKARISRGEEFIDILQRPEMQIEGVTESLLAQCFDGDSSQH